jgi:hypothetical protein
MRTDLPRGPIAIAALLLLGAGVARADCAFPDAQSVLLPPDQPRTTILAATFGLVFTDDDGATWQYGCESRGTLNGRLYTQGPAPDRRLFAVSDAGAAVSADGGCSWRVGGGLFDGGSVYDVFPDPVDARRVLAVARPPGLGELPPTQVYASGDGGLTYDRALFVGPAAGGIAGVEIARADPRTIYVATSEARPEDGATRPGLARSFDDGATWERLDLAPAFGAAQVTIAGVAPDDARRLYLRVVGQDAERLAVSEDAGATFATPVSVPGGALTTFLARASGVVLVVGRVGAGAVGFRSRDRGRGFEAWAPGIHPRGLGERGGTLFAAADDLADGFALGSSEDDGDTWRPRLRFADVQAIRACVREACLEDCGRQMSIGLFAPSVCRAPVVAEGEERGACSIAAREPPPVVAALVLLVGAWRRRR